MSTSASSKHSDRQRRDSLREVGGLRILAEILRDVYRGDETPTFGQLLRDIDDTEQDQSRDDCE